jgi:hypothetical protein
METEFLSNIPEPLVIALQDQFPGLLAVDLEGTDVFLLMGDEKGEPSHAVRYQASEEFLLAVRVGRSGLDNLLMLVGEGGLQLSLLAPEDDGDED